MSAPAGLVGRHVDFLAALRQAGVPVSLAEGVDAVAALSALRWDDREQVRTAYAATVVKRASHRPTFDTLFDLYFPRLVGEGIGAIPGPPGQDAAADGPDALAALRERLAEALATGDDEALRQLAIEAVGRFGAMPGRGPGLSGWSAYTALRRLSPDDLTSRIMGALQADGRTDEEAERAAARRVGGFRTLVEAEARRRIAEEKGADHVADVALRPSIDRLDFTAARRTDLEEMRREIYPLARRLATRLAKEQHARRRGPLDFRRTVRASVSTGGVPLTTHHRPRRPHRTELVVLCDVSGSVASFARFTLMLVFALREQFQQVRAFTFVDQVHEVTRLFVPGGDPGEVLADLAASTEHAARWGRTNYGRAFTDFAQSFPHALGPKSSLLVLGDARSNYSDLALPVLRGLAGSARHAHWLNPEHRRHWDTGDSAASTYGEIVPMTECRNLTQLGAFVHDLV
jgi:uncharacterized protein with von Willebrand factor type A (vWA) domain